MIFVNGFAFRAFPSTVGLSIYSLPGSPRERAGPAHVITRLLSLLRIKRMNGTRLRRDLSISINQAQMIMPVGKLQSAGHSVVVTHPGRPAPEKIEADTDPHRKFQLRLAKTLIAHTMLATRSELTHVILESDQGRGG